MFAIVAGVNVSFGQVFIDDSLKNGSKSQNVKTVTFFYGPKSRQKDTIDTDTLPRRELINIKTNILYDFAYMPGYDKFCSIPNVAIEIYPLKGHFTFGASFDCPWWKNYRQHKYFQVRNYQLFTRYYTRSGNILRREPGKGAAFKGFYISAYAQAALYNICFDANRGWEGEGWGGGLGFGYVVGLGKKKQHWRLEFGVQLGYFRTLYDPYQWLCPIDPENDQEAYFYKWYGEADDFQERKHAKSWIGPTRAEITLSYDLIYHKRSKTQKYRERKRMLTEGNRK